MTGIAALTLIGYLGAMVTVEVATAHVRQGIVFLWRLSVGLPLLAAIYLLWTRMDSDQPLYLLGLGVLVVAQPAWYRRWLVRHLTPDQSESVTRG